MNYIVFLFTLLVFISTLSSGQSHTHNSTEEVCIGSDSVLVNHVQNKDYFDSEARALKSIEGANESYSLEQLSDIVNFSAEHCAGSDALAEALALWLKENHAIYTGKSPTEVSQFRGFLIYSLSKFMPIDELYQQVKNELQFSNHLFNVTAAAYTAKLFTTKAPELITLLTPFLEGSFQDEWVDITTYQLDYPLLRPTCLRYETIKTLGSFGAAAHTSLTLMENMIEEENINQLHQDTMLVYLAHQAVRNISKTPLSCSLHNKPHTHTTTHSNTVKIVPEKERRKIHVPELSLLDQYGDKVKFEKLKGELFVLTFFYTSCANLLKCASTVDKLGKLQKMLEEHQLDRKVGIYGMTYDPGFDKPSLAKSYGEVYGFHFTENTKFLVPIENKEEALHHQLNLRVNYGHGSVNQHGIQLFVIDKRGRLSAIWDNELWQVTEVYDTLKALLNE